LSTVAGRQPVRTAAGEYLDGERLAPTCPSPAPQHRTPPGTLPSPCAGTSPNGFLLTDATARLTVTCACDPYSAQSLTLVGRLRGVPAPAPALFGGPTAEFQDTRDVLVTRLPWALAVVTAGMFTLLAATTRSLFLPLKALVLNALSLAGAFGTMVLVFQQGHLKWLVGDFTVTGTTSLLMPVVAFCIAFGLSMDYEILLLARITEAHRSTGDTIEATALGLQAAAPLFTASAAVVGAVLLAMATAQVTLVKLLAVTTLTAVLLDVLIVRPLLVPAVMRLADTANWWLPGRTRLLPAARTRTSEVEA
jgi:RND superfamily putative drug exporter